MEDLNSLAYANPAHRIQKPNSVPRSIGIFGLGQGGEELVARAVSAGVRAVPLSLEGVSADSSQARRPENASDLNAVVVVGRPDEEIGAAAGRIYDWARQIGVLVTAVVVSRDRSALSAGPNVNAMRANADLITLTTDEDFLPVMLQWLDSPV